MLLFVHPPRARTTKDSTAILFNNFIIKFLLWIQRGLSSCCTESPGKSAYSRIIYDSFLFLKSFSQIYTNYSWFCNVFPVFPGLFRLSGRENLLFSLKFLSNRILFVIVGIIGEYIAILFTEIKDRPVYIVRDTANFGKKRKQDTVGQELQWKQEIFSAWQAKKPRKHWKNITKSWIIS